MIKCAHFTCYACSNEEADTLRADLARVTAERDEALRHKDMFCDDAQRYAGLIGAITAERDEARAEVEAMRERVRDVVSSCAFDCNEESYCGTCGALLRAIALRARKVGG